MAKSALIVVDVQRDFCEGGALAAANTLSLLVPLEKFIDGARAEHVAIVYTKDWHPEDHSSFRENGGLWPVHCVANTPGAELMPPLKAEPGEVVIHKGVRADGAGYSGFELTGLEKRLQELKVQNVAVSGIATEYCVRATALDALQHGFAVTVLTDLIRAVQARESGKVLAELTRAGVKVAAAEQWLKNL